MSDRLFTTDAFAAGLGHSRRPGHHAVLTVLSIALRVFVTRRELAELDERMLADIGVSRAKAAAEAARLPWDCGSRRERPRPPRHFSGWRALHAAWRRHATRRRITELDSHALKDIGVSFAEAEAEANKPFWRA